MGLGGFAPPPAKFPLGEYASPPASAPAVVLPSRPAQVAVPPPPPPPPPPSAAPVVPASIVAPVSATAAAAAIAPVPLSPVSSILPGASAGLALAPAAGPFDGSLTPSAEIFRQSKYQLEADLHAATPAQPQSPAQPYQTSSFKKYSLLSFYIRFRRIILFLVDSCPSIYFFFCLSFRHLFYLRSSNSMDLGTVLRSIRRTTRALNSSRRCGRPKVST